jgi:hypothetical protein
LDQKTVDEDFSDQKTVIEHSEEATQLPHKYFEEIMENHFGLFMSSIISNLFSPFPADVNFTKLKYNER